MLNIVRNCLYLLYEFHKHFLKLKKRRKWSYIQKYYFLHSFIFIEIDINIQ